MSNTRNQICFECGKTTIHAISKYSYSALIAHWLFTLGWKAILACVSSGIIGLWLLIPALIMSLGCAFIGIIFSLLTIIEPKWFSGWRCTKCGDFVKN